MLNPDVVEQAVRGRDAVGVRRLICIGSAGIFGHDAGFVFGRIIAPLFLRHVFADKRRQVDVHRRSGLEWVLVRPAMLMDGPFTGKYRVDLCRAPGARISRADVADFVVRLLTDDRYLRQMPAIAY